MEAIAIVKLPYADVCRARGLEPARDVATAYERTHPFVPLGDDGTACFLGAPFGAELEALELAARVALGTALDAHDDVRGILVVPDVAWPDAAFPSYAAAIAHAGEGGQWVQKLDARTAEQRMVRGLDPSVLGPRIASMQSLLAQHPEAVAAAQAQLSSMLHGEPADDAGDTRADLLALAQRMMEQMTPEQQAELEAMARQVLGGLVAGQDDDDDEDD